MDSILLMDTPFSAAYCKKNGIELENKYIGTSYGYSQFRKALKREDVDKLIAIKEEETLNEKKKNPKRVEAGIKAAETRAENKRNAKNIKWQARLNETITNPAIRVLIPETYNRYWDSLIANLRDINEAHPDWLTTAKEAYAASIRHGGIMKMWTEEREDLDFYECLCGALSAYYRHEHSDYDSIDKRGMDYFEIAELRSEKTREGRYA